MRQTLKFWPLLLAACFVALADDPSWKNKPVEQWSQEDAKQVLADSPWAKSVALQRVRDLSPDERLAGGDMRAGIGKGVGFSGIGLLGASRQAEALARAHSKPDPGEVVVRWESAGPVRAAEQKLGDAAAPAVDSKNYYAIVVCDVPTPTRWNLARELRGIAALKRDKKKDLKPTRVVILRSVDGRATLVYLFRRSVEITKKDVYVEFAAQIGRLFVSQRFSCQEMQIRGQLEL
jgi:hypothetical protein